MPRSFQVIASAAIIALCAVPARGIPEIQLSAAAQSHSPEHVDPEPVSLSSPVDAAVSIDAPRDEMLRGAAGQWQHWTAAPALVVVTSVMQYDADARGQYLATSEMLSASDTGALVADLTDALQLLTNGVFDRFNSVEFESVPSGNSVAIVRPKQIVVGRYRGLQEVARTLGFGGRKAAPNGAIISGAILLDHEFDRTSADRRLLRTHELGHALGYNHVTSRTSIMNPRIGPRMTDSDLEIVRFAFNRLPSPSTN